VTPCVDSHTTRKINYIIKTLNYCFCIKSLGCLMTLRMHCLILNNATVLLDVTELVAEMVLV